MLEVRQQIMCLLVISTVQIMNQCLSGACHRMSISPSLSPPVSPLISSPSPSLASPQPPRHERACRVSETLTTPSRNSLTHWFWASLCIGLPGSCLASVPMTHCHVCTYCVFPVCRFLSHHLKHDRQPLPILPTPLLGFMLRSCTNIALCLLFEVFKARP